MKRIKKDLFKQKILLNYTSIIYRYEKTNKQTKKQASDKKGTN